MSAKKAPKPGGKQPVASPTVTKKSSQDNDPLGDESSWLSPVMKFSALGLICLMSFSIRLFAVARWESVRLPPLPHLPPVSLFSFRGVCARGPAVAVCQGNGVRGAGCCSAGELALLPLPAPPPRTWAV